MEITIRHGLDPLIVGVPDLEKILDAAPQQFYLREDWDNLQYGWWDYSFRIPSKQLSSEEERLFSSGRGRDAAMLLRYRQERRGDEISLTFLSTLPTFRYAAHAGASGFSGDIQCDEIVVSKARGHHRSIDRWHARPSGSGRSLFSPSAYHNEEMIAALDHRSIDRWYAEVSTGIGGIEFPGFTTNAVYIRSDDEHAQQEWFDGGTRVIQHALEKYPLLGIYPSFATSARKRLLFAKERQGQNEEAPKPTLLKKIMGSLRG